MGGNHIFTGTVSFEHCLPFGLKIDDAHMSMIGLEEGDKITAETGDSSTYTYVVKTTSICSNKEAETVLPKAEQRIEGEETLSLIATNDGNSSFVVVKAILESQNK